MLFRSNGVKSKAMVESEDEGDNVDEDADDDEGAGPSKKASPPPTKKAKRDKEEGDDGELLSLFLRVFSIVLCGILNYLFLSFDRILFFNVMCTKILVFSSAKHATDPQADQVRDWRHRLQKVFLSNKALPKYEVRSSSSYHN